MKIKIAVIGNGAMTLTCVNHMHAHDQCEVKLIITNPNEISPSLEKRTRNFCKNKCIKYINTSDLNSEMIVNSLQKFELDYIFNIDSYTIIRAAVLKLPNLGVINFHNSPLPKYRGANAPSWAIINDEKEFGVTWHFLDEDVDTGEILWKTTFQISANETARSLIFKCVEAGITLLKQNFHTLLESKPETEKQSAEGSRYFKRDIPSNGYIDFSWPTRKIDCMIRGLDYRPFENPFIRAKACLGDAEYFINKIKIISDDIKVQNISAGKILSVSSKGIEITAADGVILIEDMSMVDSGESIDFMSMRVNS